MPNDRQAPFRAPRTLLEKLIKEREATYEEQTHAFEKLARDLDEPATMSVSPLAEVGRRPADRDPCDGRRARAG